MDDDGDVFYTPPPVPVSSSSSAAAAAATPPATTPLDGDDPPPVANLRTEIGASPQAATPTASGDVGDTGATATKKADGFHTPPRRHPAPSAEEKAEADALKARGNDAYREGKYHTALQFYDRAIDICPGVSTYHGNRAAVLWTLERIDECVFSCVCAFVLCVCVSVWVSHQSACCHAVRDSPLSITPPHTHTLTGALRPTRWRSRLIRSTVRGE